MNIKLNEEDVSIECTTLKELLELYVKELPVNYAVAINSKIIPKTEYENTLLHENDEVEIYSFVVGG